MHFCRGESSTRGGDEAGPEEEDESDSEDDEESSDLSPEPLPCSISQPESFSMKKKKLGNEKRERNDNILYFKPGGVDVEQIVKKIRVQLDGPAWILDGRMRLARTAAIY